MEDRIVSLLLTDEEGATLATLSSGSERELRAIVGPHIAEQQGWEDCENGCCASASGIGNYEGLSFQIVPARTSQELTDFLVELGPEVHAARIEADAYLRQIEEQFGGALQQLADADEVPVVTEEPLREVGEGQGADPVDPSFN